MIDTRHQVHQLLLVYLLGFIDRVAFCANVHLVTLFSELHCHGQVIIEKVGK